MQNFILIFSLVIAVLIFIVWLIIKILKIQSSVKRQNEIEQIGKDGEKKVAKILGKSIPDRQYIINNFLFTDENGASCQIDHIVINRNGIFVIETKNYSGIIYGSKTQREWLQVQPYKNQEKTFYNPLMQNDTHIYRLSRYLNAKNLFHNIVVFLDNADISNVSTIAFPSSAIPSLINMNFGFILSAQQINDIYYRLLDLKKNNRISEKAHVKRIKTAKYKIEHNICPKCGGRLVVRNTQIGKFYGCENYPNCKFRKEL